ncbi:MAG: hypothetical protein KGH75_08300 [Rhodospirillales bacterium]|nr:hypothetical protein [Rhodospirillales bacterium]
MTRYDPEIVERVELALLDADSEDNSLVLDPSMNRGDLRTLAKAALGALLTERNAAYDLLRCADALLEALTPDADSELTDAEVARLWNATRDKIAIVLAQKANTPPPEKSDE